jgi:hypothetical protein
MVIIMAMDTMITGQFTIHIMIIIITTIIRTGIHPTVTHREGAMEIILNLFLIIIMIPDERRHTATLQGMNQILTGLEINQTMAFTLVKTGDTIIQQATGELAMRTLIMGTMDTIPITEITLTVL